jgi:hypothetical protein
LGESERRGERQQKKYREDANRMDVLFRGVHGK